MLKRSRISSPESAVTFARRNGIARPKSPRLQNAWPRWWFDTVWSGTSPTFAAMSTADWPDSSARSLSPVTMK